MPGCSGRRRRTRSRRTTSSTPATTRTKARSTTTEPWTEAADAVFLKVYADDKLFKTESQKPAADKTYAFTVKLKPGLIKYQVEFGTRTGDPRRCCTPRPTWSAATPT